MEYIHTHENKRKTAGRAVSLHVIVLNSGCIYSRMAITSLLSEIHQDNTVYTFECISDYNLWRRTINTGRYHVVLTAADTALYQEDIPSFLRQEQQLSALSDETEQYIMLFPQNSHGSACPEALSDRYLKHLNGCLSLTVVENIHTFSRIDMLTLLRQFTGGQCVTGVREPRFNDLRTLRGRMTACEIRAIRILLSGRNMHYWASHFGVSPKTLYTQRKAMLSRLGLENRHRAVLWLSAQPDFMAASSPEE